MEHLYLFLCLMCGYQCMLNMYSIYRNPHVLCFSADVLGGSVNEPLEPRGAGEERPRELPHPLATDYQKDQRGKKTNKGQRSWSKRTYCFTVTECGHFDPNYILLCFLILMCVQVQEQCQYELVAPLAIMFSSTLLQVQITLIQIIKNLNISSLLSTSVSDV